MSAPDEKIPLAETEFGQVVHGIAVARSLLAAWDVEGLHALMSDRDGMLAFRDPTLFLAVQGDPNWQAKCDLVEAAARFVRAVDLAVQKLGESK